MLPSNVLEDIRKKVEGGLGPLTKGGTDDLAGALFGKAQGAADQLSGFASAIGEWVAFAREFIRAEVRDVVESDVAGMGFASAKALEELAARVERLERGDARAASRKKPSGKPSPREKAKRKAIARDIDALTARVERLERDAGSADAQPRAAAANDSTDAAPRKARAKRPARTTTARARSPVQASKASASNPERTKAAARAARSGSPTSTRPASGR